MQYPQIAKEIITLKNKDLALRLKLIETGKLGDGYNSDMEILHNQNAEKLDRIIDNIGYPTIAKVGEDASNAAWLIIQHSIGMPHFMLRCLYLLENAVAEHTSNPIHLAYLTDRVAVLQGRPQLYGTQFDWDVKGEMSPSPFDNLLHVNARRKSLGLNTLEEQTLEIRKRVLSEGQIPPSDYSRRKQTYDAWRKEVGWIK